MILPIDGHFINWHQYLNTSSNVTWSIYINGIENGVSKLVTNSFKFLSSSNPFTHVCRYQQFLFKPYYIMLKGSRVGFLYESRCLPIIQQWNLMVPFSSHLAEISSKLLYTSVNILCRTCVQFCKMSQKSAEHYAW